MGIFDIMLHVRRLMMFGLAVLIGFLFQYMAIPIPFLLGRHSILHVLESYRRTGILAAPVARTGPLRSRLRHWAQLYGRNHARTFHAVTWCA